MKDNFTLAITIVGIVVFVTAIILWLASAHSDCISYGFSQAFCWAVVF